MSWKSHFEEIWSVDTEFGAAVDQRPSPRCLVAVEILSGRRIDVWLDGAGRVDPPFDLGPSSLIIAYSAQAELRCFAKVDWPLPANLICLYAEFRNATNGLPNGRGLVDAQAYFGEPHIELRVKAQMRDLALRGGPYTASERADLIDYCSTDVYASNTLVRHLLPDDMTDDALDRALLRGRFIRAVAVTEDIGIPVDRAMLERIRGSRLGARAALVTDPSQTLGFYQGTTFRAERFADFVAQRGILWPRHPSGHLDLSRDTMRRMAKLFPEIAPVARTRSALAQLQEFAMTATPDNRMRPSLWPFSSTTGRSQPRARENPFLVAKWLRGIVVSQPGWGIIYVDWEQQEFGIAAALSGDLAMQRAYNDADPYIRFGILAGLLPAWATKKTHPRERERLKQCALGVLFGKTAFSLARDLAIPLVEAQDLVAAHRRAFPTFWRWSESFVDSALIWRETQTTFGWTLRVGKDANPRSLMNFPMQATGAELMQLALIFAVEAGVRVCTTLHDGFVLEARAGEEKAAAAAMQRAMSKAVRVVLGDFTLRADEQFFRYPNSMLDDDHRAIWDVVQRAIASASEEVHQP